MGNKKSSKQFSYVTIAEFAKRWMIHLGIISKIIHRLNLLVDSKSDRIERQNDDSKENIRKYIGHSMKP